MQENNFIMKPKIDFCFKELMMLPEVRRGFISAVLGIRPEEVIRTELLPTHLRAGREKDKLGILDVRVKLNGNIQIDMEIQVARFMLWQERSLFYLSKMYSEEIHVGEDYHILGKCIHVGILDFMLFKEDEEFSSCFHLWEDKRRRMYSDKFEIHIIELPKLALYEYPETTLLKWAKFISAEKKEEFEMIAKTDPHIQEAYEQLLHISEDEEKRLEYEARQKAIWDYNTQVYSNWHSGYEEGEKKGEQKGITIGEEKKLMEQVCKKMRKNCSVQEIADILEEEESIIQGLYDIASKFAPDYDVEKIMQVLESRRKQTAV